MNDHQLDQLVRRAEPGAAAQLGALDLHRGELELLEEIMSTSVTPQHISPDDERDDSDEPENPADQALSTDLGTLAPAAAAGRRQRRALISVAATVAFVAALTGPAIVLHGRNEVQVVAGSQSAQALAAVGSNPKMLLDDPAWAITHVDQSSASEGEIQFSQGRRYLQVNWRAADQYQGYYKDRLDVSRPGKLQLFGRKAALFTYSSTDYAAMLPPLGRSFIEIRGEVGDRAEFLAVLGKLQLVSVADWIAAMPASVVTPQRAGETAKQMLTGVPLPPGFDRSKLSTTLTKDYYQYGAAVIDSVTCGWLGVYQQAMNVGDKAAMARVGEALLTSRHWAVLLRMDKEGDYPDGVWQLADRVAKGKYVSSSLSNCG